jgi:hypothetical protein
VLLLRAIYVTPRGGVGGWRDFWLPRAGLSQGVGTPAGSSKKKQKKESQKESQRSKKKKKQQQQTGNQQQQQRQRQKQRRPSKAGIKAMPTQAGEDEAATDARV